MSTIPAELSYTSEHEWISAADSDGVVSVGITDHAQDSLGDVVYVDLPDSGSAFEANESFGEVESTKSVSDLYMPVAGEIVEVNTELADRPEVLNSDPYGAGWLVRVRPSDPESLNELLDAKAYEAEIS
ncbi:glycine cleavage system protein GcvH [Rothia sp. HC945]|uniref:glycine cleavage system protein GcvH n=1 Tax=Rothia sp. HC945 TaxID=3171170 RepID=UPI00264E1928|nr:glycine cleavage system protein GcvH [Kocuria sp.]MDN5616717.1 glycine cleavage system protein GcvH [Kocuria sp.]MDN5653745.1 glycine cleavage system protein GcvH [Kocuria sp.]